MANSIYTPPSGPPQVNAPHLFTHMGEENIQRLAGHFYELLSDSSISHLFPEGEDLIAAAQKQGDFLIGILGGPPRYLEKHGSPRMRARHLPFPIDEAARQEWLRCFRAALGDGQDYGLSESQARELLSWLEAFSAWMVNRL